MKRSDEELRAAVRARGWQPARAEADELFRRLGAPDREPAAVAARALARLGPPAAEAARARFADARPPLRARLVALVGRVAQTHAAAAHLPFLLQALGDHDKKTRRNAAIALGKLGGPGVEAALVGAWPAAAVEERRSLAAALGKVGGPAALALLAEFATDDSELGRIVDEARLKLERTLGRAEAVELDAAAPAPAPTAVWLHCRRGLEALVVDELGSSPGARARVEAPGRVSAILDGPLASLYRSRCMLRFGFPLPVTPGALEPAVVGALISDEARALFGAWSRGPLRYRIEWASAGHRRGLTFRVARAVARARPELINDPTRSPWEAVVDESGGRLTVELWPRGLADPRFAYRRAHAPASSHPTLAAALARLGGARPDDVVWDPFVGAATELIERARLGPFRALYGSDLDAAALALARANLGAAGVAGVELQLGDARAFRPPARPTLILTNPPMGRRVLKKELIDPLLDGFLAHAAGLLAPGGRLVWISPRPEHTLRVAARAGLVARLERRVDMGGFWAELQIFDQRRA
jgi:23S rRNA G2445 N2-methylase RlmL